MKPLIFCTLGLLVCVTSALWFMLRIRESRDIMLDLGTIGVRFEPMLNHGWQPTTADLMQARRIAKSFRRCAHCGV